MSKATNKEEKNFEEKIRELEEIVKSLESGEVELAMTMEKYQKAMELAGECSKELNQATEQVNTILKENGELVNFEISQE